MKDLIIIGGPNGAGKTTMAAHLLPQELGIREFVNADNIAAGLSPFAPEAAAIPAARVMLNRIRELVRAERSFALETTCAGLGHARLIALCQESGWRITLVFLYLDGPDIALMRVVRRVAEGGHSIPPDVVRRRYWIGLRNMLTVYLPLTNAARVYDNSLGTGILIAHKTPHDGVVVHDPVRWTRLRERAHEGPVIR